MQEREAPLTPGLGWAVAAGPSHSTNKVKARSGLKHKPSNFTDADNLSPYSGCCLAHTPTVTTQPEALSYPSVLSGQERSCTSPHCDAVSTESTVLRTLLFFSAGGGLRKPHSIAIKQLGYTVSSGSSFQETKRVL